jgi:hypothetical protein
MVVDGDVSDSDALTDDKDAGVSDATGGRQSDRGGQ